VANTEPVLSRARPLRDALYGDLVWSRPGLFRRELRLESGSDLIARLRWERFLSFEATGEAADGRWIFTRHRLGSFRGSVTMREAESGVEVATFTRHWRGTGAITFASGAQYTWVRIGFWRPTFAWRSEGHERLLAYKWVFTWRGRFDMEVDPAARDLAELPALVLMGGYVMALIAAQRRSH
jgi:hypothetical protein